MERKTIETVKMPLTRREHLDNLLAEIKNKETPGLKKYTVKPLQYAWWWLDSKKTWGGLLVGIAGPIAFAPPLGTAIGYAGLSLAGVGGVHKVIKGVGKAIKSEEPTTWKTIIVEILKEFIEIVLKKLKERK